MHVYAQLYATKYPINGLCLLSEIRKTIENISFAAFCKYKSEIRVIFCSFLIIIK